MRAVVVYESHWGNTARVARAIAEGLGPEARALSTTEATAEALDDARLVVAGAPLMAFRLPSDRMVQGLAPKPDEPPPEVSDPTMRSWLETLPRGTGAAAAFETKLRWSPGGATGAIEHGLEAAGYRPIATGTKFYVEGRTGPLKPGELEKARAWGAELARIIGPEPSLASPA
jgi:flavorubredoxin